GCETRVLDPDNCGACGRKCPEGQSCISGPLNVYPETRKVGCFPPLTCASNEEACVTGYGDESIAILGCIEPDHDPDNCWRCSVRLSAVDGVLAERSDAHVTVACHHGVCEMNCQSNWADCDNDPVNGCEANVLTDGENCGGCGIVCEYAQGQP